MSPLVTLPNTLQDRVDVAYGSQVKANDDAIVQVVHNLDYQNIKPGANLQGTVISSTPGSRIPTDRIEDDAITADKLKDDSSAGSPLAAVATAHHIKDGIITKAKMLAGTLTLAQMDILVQSTAVSFTLSNTFTGSGGVGTGIPSHSVERATSGANYVFYVRAWGVNGAGLGRYGISAALSPGTAISTATYIVLAAYLDTVAYNTGTSGFTANLITVALKVS